MLSLIDHFQGRKAPLLEFIRALVERETTSREAARLDEIANFIAPTLHDLGGKIELTPVPGYGTHLRARFFDQKHERADAERLLVIGHLDTVWPVGTLARLPFRVTDEGTAHGPGIFDMKSGIAAVIEAIRAITSFNLPTKRPLTLLLTCDEEIGSQTSRALVEEEASRAAAALVCEPPVAGGIIKTARKGIGDFTVRAIGRAAHAGLDPTKGVNAIVELAHQTLRLAALNDFDRGTTVSVGVFSGGTTSNVVPAEATARVDLRFWDLEEGARIDETIRSFTPVLPGARLEIEGKINRPPMRRTSAVAAL
jgi:glutamate carboxypeptidase